MKNNNAKSFLFKVIIILWLLNMILSFFDSELQIYNKIISAFSNSTYINYYCHLLRFLVFVIGWLAILSYSILHRKAKIKFYNLILCTIILISIFTIGLSLNYYRDYNSILKKEYLKDTVNKNQITAILPSDSSYFNVIKYNNGDEFILSSSDYNKIMSKFKINELDAANNSGKYDENNTVTIHYLKYTGNIVYINN